MAAFSMATSETWTKDGEKDTRTEWHRVVAFGRLAEICGEYLTKGKQVYIEGRIQTREWNDKEGNPQKTTEILAAQLVMLGGSGGARQQQSQSSVDNDPVISDGYNRSGNSVVDDDLPF
jgi:single-strand DNA-binding protein